MKKLAKVIKSQIKKIAEAIKAPSVKKLAKVVKMKRTKVVKKHATVDRKLAKVVRRHRQRSLQR